MRAISSGLIAGLLCAGAAASGQPTRSEFEAAVAEYSACMIATVRMGMTTKMDPAAFKAGLERSCKAEEARFRAAATRHVVAQGRTEAEAAAEIEGNLARGKAIWAEDQAAYMRTGKVPN